MILKNRGFTLVEVIISIAVLSIICVIFLQLFVKAKDISDQSSELDQSLRLTNTGIEYLRAVKNLDDLNEMKYFSTFERVETAEGFELTKGYDSSFQVTDSEAAYQLHFAFTVLDSIDTTSINLFQEVAKAIHQDVKN